MKAGFVQALYALKGIEGEVALVATTDEEIGSHASKALIMELSAKADAVLVLEASLDGKVKTGRKGTSMYQISVHGQASHAGLQLAGLEDSAHGTTVVPTTLKSGTTTNTVPDLATLDVDVRSFSQAELHRVDAAIRTLTVSVSGARVEVTGGLNRPPLAPSSTKELYEIAEAVAAKIGMPPLGSANVGGASDGNFAAAAGARVLDGLGAVGGGAHAANEWVDASTIESRSALLHALIKELLV
jgi:glutamate carboxypeptidase